MRILLLIFVVTTVSTTFSQDCDPENNFFNPGEKINYQVFYHWGFVWVSAGEASFAVDTNSYKGESVYHFQGIGKSYPKWDWVYKVNDKYESFAQKSNLAPLFFRRRIEEGNEKMLEEYTFKTEEKRIYTYAKKENMQMQNTVPYTTCTFDPMSMVYYARCLKYSDYQKDEKIPLTMVIDGQVYETYLRYKGKEIIDVKNQGKFKTLKFSVLLIEGTMFKGGEGMTVWVSDDKNRIPVQIESEILVGTVNVALTSTQGLKYPLEAKVKD